MFKASFKLHRISDVGFIDDAAEDLPIKCQELEGFQSNSTLILSDDRYIYRKNRTPKEGEALHVICANSRITGKMRKTSPDVLQECKGKIDRHCYLLSFHTDFTNRIYLSLSATGTIDNNGIIKLSRKHTHTPGTQSFFVPLSFKGHQDLKMSFFVLYRRSSSRGSARQRRKTTLSPKSAETRKRLRQGEAEEVVTMFRENYNIPEGIISTNTMCSKNR